MAPSKPRRPSYKDVLQPALHRRFTAAGAILLGISYLYAILLGRWNSFFWSWFPLGPVTLRTSLIFPTSLAVLILRIAQYHVGLRTSNSAFDTFLRHTAKLQTVEAIFTYTLASLYFGQVYLTTIPESAGFEWLTFFLSDRARLNEKTIFFSIHFGILGAYQGLLHLFRDDDRLSLGVVTPIREGEGKNDISADPWKALLEKLPSVIMTSIHQSVVSIVISLFVYPMFLRTGIWRTMLFFLRPIYNLPRTNLLPTSYAFLSIGTLSRCFIAGFLLLVLIFTGNIAFSLFLAREPVKNGKPLTSDSKDPNGSLLNGMKSKKDAIKAFALWELAFIARDYTDRRKGIYDDIDRSGGPMWSQTYGVCVDVLKSLETRLDEYGKPPAALPPAEEKVEPRKRMTAPPREDNIFQTTPQKAKFVQEVEKVVNQVAVAPGQGSQLSPLAKRALATGKQQLLQAQKEITGSDDPRSVFKDLAVKVVNSAVGWPFRREYGRRLAAAVLGTPYGEPSVYINTVSALSALALHSLSEDKYGNVQRDVATIIRTLTNVTKKLDKFSTDLTPHWTDVASRRESAEINEILQTFKEALGQLVRAFEPYARELRLSMADIRMAKEAAVVVGQDRGPEMQQVG